MIAHALCLQAQEQNAVEFRRTVPKKTARVIAWHGGGGYEVWGMLPAKAAYCDMVTHEPFDPNVGWQMTPPVTEREKSIHRQIAEGTMVLKMEGN